MAAVTPAELIAQANCFNCYATNPYMLQLMELALLAQIVTGGGTGGGGTIYWEDTGPTPSGPPPNQTLVYMIFFRDGSPPLTWDPSTLTWK